VPSVVIGGLASLLVVGLWMRWFPDLRASTGWTQPSAKN